MYGYFLWGFFFITTLWRIGGASVFDSKHEPTYLDREFYEMALLSKQVQEGNKEAPPEGYIQETYIDYRRRKKGFLLYTESVSISQHADRIVCAFAGVDPIRLNELVELYTSLSWSDLTVGANTTRGERGELIERVGGKTIGKVGATFNNIYTNYFTYSLLETDCIVQDLWGRCGQRAPGFLHNLERVLKLPGNEHKPVVLTGYSKGGALATLAGMQLHLDESLGEVFARFRGDNGTQNFKVVTFGEPRVLSRGLENVNNEPWHRIEKYRFIFQEDIVSMIPFNSVDGLWCRLLGFCQPFEHTGNYVYHLTLPKTSNETSFKKMGRCGTTDRGYKNSDYPCDFKGGSVVDHFFGYYIDALKSAAGV